MQGEQHMGGICLYSYAKKKFPYLEGEILEFLLWLRTKVTFIDNGISFRFKIIHDKDNGNESFTHRLFFKIM